MRSVPLTFPTLASACGALQPAMAISFDHVRQMVTVAPQLIQLETEASIDGGDSVVVIVFPRRARRPSSQAVSNEIGRIHNMKKIHFQILFPLLSFM